MWKVRIHDVAYFFTRTTHNTNLCGPFIRISQHLQLTVKISICELFIHVCTHFFMCSLYIHVDLPYLFLHRPGPRLRKRDGWPQGRKCWTWRFPPSRIRPDLLLHPTRGTSSPEIPRSGYDLRGRESKNGSIGNGLSWILVPFKYFIFCLQEVSLNFRVPRVADCLTRNADMGVRYNMLTLHITFWSLDTGAAFK